MGSLPSEQKTCFRVSRLQTRGALHYQPGAKSLEYPLCFGRCCLTKMRARPGQKTQLFTLLVEKLAALCLRHLLAEPQTAGCSGGIGGQRRGCRVYGL